MTRRGKVIRFPTRPPEPRDSRSLVAVHRCDRAEAVVVKSLFESGGIPTLLRSRLALGRRDHREAVGGDAARGERPVVAPEERNTPDDVVAHVPPEAEGFERAAHTTEEGRLVARVPHREAVADAAELQAQHAGDPRHLGLAHPGPRAEIAELL